MDPIDLIGKVRDRFLSLEAENERLVEKNEELEKQLKFLHKHTRELELEVGKKNMAASPEAVTLREATMEHYSITRHHWYWSEKDASFNEFVQFLLKYSYWFKYEYNSGQHTIICGVSPESYNFQQEKK